MDRLDTLPTLARLSGGIPELLAYGYVFDQSAAINEFGLGVEAALVLPAFNGERASLAKITEMTGVIFADILHKAEHKGV